MLRKSVRERKVYLHHKSLALTEEAILEKKRRLKTAIDNGQSIPSDLRKEERDLRSKLDLDDETAESRLTRSQDDEYAYAGLKDPKVIITTSRDPSSRLQQFIKEFRLLIPNAQKINRGSYVIKDIVELCKSNDVTDILIIHETRGDPDCLVVCHLPYGPTAYFALSNVVLRHDLPEKPGPISEVSPHLVFENFSSKLGHRISSILKYLFPPPRVTGTRLEAFINVNDFIHFRHYNWEESNQPIQQESTQEKKKEPIKLKMKPNEADKIILYEAGPRFILRPFRVENGTVDMKDLDCEWSLRPYFNKPKQALN